jgi:hypothetical protein
MAQNRFLYPKNQYSVLETFSPTTSDNVTQVNKYFFGVPEVENDLSTDLICKNSTGPVSFYLQVNGTDIRVLAGSCVINGYQIFIEETEIDPNNINNYLFQDLGDGPPTENGHHIIYIAIRYNPTAEDPNAYLGFITDRSLYTAFKDELCFLWAIDVNVVDNMAHDIGSQLIYDPEIPENCRDGFWDIIDGGWL